MTNVLYNPHVMERDALIAMFVARKALLAELLDDLRRGGRQHHLLVGARGAGKTMLLLRLAYGIEDDAKLTKTCVPLRFPEEQYNVSRLSDFWVNCLDALTDALEQQDDHEGAKQLDSEIERLETLEENERAGKALGLLTAWAKRAKKTLVLLVDNLDIVLERLEDLHWPIREALSADNRLVVVGTSSTYMQEAFDYDTPFYEFFNVHELGSLPEEEARNLVKELGRLGKTPDVEHIVSADPGRFKALYVLSGGMPRTLALLHGILTMGKDTRVEQDLEHMLDQLTPYYKARFDDLPAQSQVIMDVVALHWHPITAAECARRARLGVNVISAQLDRLSKQGLLVKVALSGASKLGFQVAERFFNIWYLMRASRRLRRRLLWLVEFLRVFYGEGEIERRAEQLLATPSGRKAVVGSPAKMLAFASAVEDADLRRRLELEAIQSLVREYCRRDELHEMLDLDGEDAHLAPVVNRMRVLRDIREHILKAKVSWPAGMTAASVAEKLLGLATLPLKAKATMAKRLTSGKLVWKQVAGISSTEGERTGPRLHRAIERGELPSLPDVTTADEVDKIALWASDSRLTLFLMLLLREFYSNFRTPDEVITRVLQKVPTVVTVVFAFAEAAIESDHWERGQCRFLQVTQHLDRLGKSPKPRDLNVFFRTCLEHRPPADVLALLEKANLRDRMLPLYEAVRGAAAGPAASLAHLAPEVRAPAQEILDFLLKPEPPPEANSKAITATEVRRQRQAAARTRRMLLLPGGLLTYDPK